ncbi:hypothetical protein QB910_000018 [Dabrowskivirus KKP3916]|uniref:Terminase large subunit n=1 Tax=Alicyclobacillus phage KKP_3916 TaxID=3040651 RepID=A0AAT9V7U7_9CAUD|nr:hypothetical protein QB910_000018 [Alicyclobacillus phage KKP 3916]
MDKFKVVKKKDHNIYEPEGNSFEKENLDQKSRIQEMIDIFRKYASFFREYPDIFIDEITPKDSYFSLFFYQRVFLRAAMRHRYMYATFTRAFSKSFLSILTLYLRCIFYPGTKMFVCSGGKEQSAKIAKSKVEELWTFFPILKNEIKDYSFQKDYIELIFHNGSRLDVVAVRDSERGGRKNGGLVEEVILVDGDKLNSVVIPLMNVDRISKNGKVDPNEVTNKSQIYVTTAGYKNTFAYQKLQSLLVWMALGRSSFVFGGGYRIPVKYGLLSQNFVEEELKDDPTFNPMAFEREYESKWSGSNEGAFFNSDLIDKHRILKKPEFAPNRKNKAEYVIAADVARSPTTSSKNNCDTAAVVIKMIPLGNGMYMKHVVNIYTFNGEHFQDQSIKLKKLVRQYGARQLCVDGNGLGVGLIDYLIKPNVDENTGEIFEAYSVTNNSDYDKFKTKDSLPLLYVIKANVSNNSDIHVNAFSQISGSKVKFLIPSIVAKSNLLDTAEGQKLRHENNQEFAELMAPYVQTDLLKEEMLNLGQKQEGKSLKLEPINNSINKDKWSALEYGLWYIKSLEDKGMRRKVVVDDFETMFLFKSPKLR